jgi:hypothetical protein
MRVRRTAAVVIGMGLLVPITTSCTQDDSPVPTPSAETGVLQSVGDPSHVCVPVGSDSLAVIGLDLLKNVGSAPVSVTDVSLVDGTGLEVVGASLAPDSDTTAFRGVATGGELSHVENPVGQIAPGERVTLQVTLRLIGNEGDAAALRVHYTSTAPTQSAVADTSMGITLLPEGAICNEPDLN